MEHKTLITGKGFGKGEEYPYCVTASENVSLVRKKFKERGKQE